MKSFKDLAAELKRQYPELKDEPLMDDLEQAALDAEDEELGEDEEIHAEGLDEADMEEDMADIEEDAADEEALPMDMEMAEDEDEDEAMPPMPKRKGLKGLSMPPRSKK